MVRKRGAEHHPEWMVVVRLLLCCVLCRKDSDEKGDGARGPDSEGGPITSSRRRVTWPWSLWVIAWWYQGVQAVDLGSEARHGSVFSHFLFLQVFLVHPPNLE